MPIKKKSAAFSSQKQQLPPPIAATIPVPSISLQKEQPPPLIISFHGLDRLGAARSWPTAASCTVNTLSAFPPLAKHSKELKDDGRQPTRFSCSAPRRRAASQNRAGRVQRGQKAAKKVMFISLSLDRRCRCAGATHLTKRGVAAGCSANRQHPMGDLGSCMN